MFCSEAGQWLASHHPHSDSLSRDNLRSGAERKVLQHITYMTLYAFVRFVLILAP